jgi:hypothetical protein
MVRTSPQTGTRSLRQISSALETVCRCLPPLEWLFNLTKSLRVGAMIGPNGRRSGVRRLACIHVASKRMWPCGTSILLP